jgi:ATP-binding cassette subfamily F protein 3
MTIKILLKEQFQLTDPDVARYVETALGCEDFNSFDQFYSELGPIFESLEGSQKKPLDEIKSSAKTLWNQNQELQRIALNGSLPDALVLQEEDEDDVDTSLTDTKSNHENIDLRPQRLVQPIIISVEFEKSTLKDTSSIFLNSQVDKTLRVDRKRLEKAEAKLRSKQERREAIAAGLQLAGPKKTYEPVSASTTQQVSKRDVKNETTKVRDIKLENFDISFGDRVLLHGADMTLVYGRRYGLCGRNGYGKSTLLRMISSRQLIIPKNITILHVEQEVAGDDTTVIDSLLQTDEVRYKLIVRERDLSAQKGEMNEKDLKELADVHAKLQELEADSEPARASSILYGLGFTQAMQQRPTKEYSGGWRMRIALARALFAQPDLLLLDEPTNMLDFKANLWLRDYLTTKWESTLLVVSHDREFLNTVPTDILHLHSQRLDAYRGNYELFMRTKAEKIRNQIKEYEAQQQLRQHTQDFIDRFRFNAKRAALVQSKIKMLEKLPVIKPVEKETPVVFRFPDPSAISGTLFQLDDVSFKYTPDGPFILKNVNISASLESRICIVGDNGSGKTTLLKIITGENEPTSGEKRGKSSAIVGYFSQHHVDQLPMDLNPVQCLAKRFPGKSLEVYRASLGKFGITGDLALQSIETLSGGQKSRVAFASMIMTNPHMLVLDEPTNHLDVESIEALAAALIKFQGAVVLVSHDEQFIKSVCKELWYVENGSVTCLKDGFDEYVKLVKEALEKMH